MRISRGPTRNSTIVSTAWLLLTVCASGCGGSEAANPAEIEPGVGIGPVALGTRYSDLELGEPDEGITLARQSMLQYHALGLEVVLASGEETRVSGDAYVLAVSAEPGSGFDGPAAPGKGRADIEGALGPPSFEAAGIAYWTAGVSVVWDGDAAGRVAVFPPFEVEQEVPEMLPAAGGAS